MIITQPQASSLFDIFVEHGNMDEKFNTMLNRDEFAEQLKKSTIITKILKQKRDMKEYSYPTSDGRKIVVQFVYDFGALDIYSGYSVDSQRNSPVINISNVLNNRLRDYTKSLPFTGKVRIWDFS